METQEVTSKSMATAYREWRESAKLDFLDRIPDSLLHYMFCVGWTEKEKQSIEDYSDDILKQINNLFK